MGKAWSIQIRSPQRWKKCPAPRTSPCPGNRWVCCQGWSSWPSRSRSTSWTQNTATNRLIFWENPGKMMGNPRKMIGKTNMNCGTPMGSLGKWSTLVFQIYASFHAKMLVVSKLQKWNMFFLLRLSLSFCSLKKVDFWCNVILNDVIRGFLFSGGFGW